MYETLEQSIIKLWKSRGLKVEEIKVEAVDSGEGKMKWTITATEEKKGG